MYENGVSLRMARCYFLRLAFLCCQYDGEMNIKLGKYIVNAKSILSILCLDLQNNLILEVESSESMSVFISKLELYIVSDSYYL
jgi:phosphotransferase system HPr-like phosphotransfer protein